MFPLQVSGISLMRFKEFKEFLTCYFTSPLVKFTDNLWKVLGIVDGFNESCRYIASGVVKITDSSMSSISFHTAPKVYLPHYSYIFRNLEPLGTEMKNMACYGLGTILHLDIYKGG